MTAPQTAHDAVSEALRAWAYCEVPLYTGSPEGAVLAALGIPPDTTVDDVRAGLALLAMVTRRGSPEVCTWETASDYRARFRPLNRGGIVEPGASPAAAVLALAAKLQEQNS